MTSLSPFQTLPFRITDAIVQRVLENNCRYTAAVGEFADRDRQKALLWSCSNFHKVTYERLGQIYKLKPDSTTGSMESELDPLLRLSTPHGHCPRHLAKVVNVEVDLGDVLCGRALKVLRKSDSCIVFRRARVLKLTFGRQPSDTGYKLDVAEVAVNCAAFAEYINQMAPAVSEICISLDTHPRLPLSDVPHFGSLVSRLLPLAPCIQYSYVMQKSLTGLQMAESCNLAHIRCSIHPDDGEQLMLLAQLNAKTLQTLNVRSSKQVDTAGLIVDANGGYMEYPCLQTLMLDFTGDRVLPI
ncbi:hypothetical protein GGI04_001840 [Coemansia thaxteri]|nr:hypothetical protein GGI04_001840 [Coemansia thaxteri]